MTKGDEYKGLEILKDEITKARERILEDSMLALLSSWAFPTLHCEEVGFSIYR